jgi:HD-GYP domain-containing protein (c-di-GMP phosphodiesterase class II)
MTSTSTSARRVQAVVAGAWTVAAIGQLTVDRLVGWHFDLPVISFALVVVAAGLCVVLAAFLLHHGFSAGLAETTLLGSFLLAVSLLPFAHGLLMPGVLYGPNDATTVTVLAAVPVGSVALFPLLAPDNLLAHRLVRGWRPFVVAHVSIVVALTVLALAAPNLVPAPAGRHWVTLAAVGWAVAWCGVASIRHASLAIISGHTGSLGVAVGFALVGSAPLMFVAADPFGAGFWLAHLLDSTGVLLAAGLGLATYRRTGTLQRIMAPLEASTPVRALEIGLDPLVHRFVADLERKDELTRDHVVRTARMAVRLAEDVGLAPADIRNVGVAAILHDVGKLEIPDEILTKTGRLTEDEFEIMKTHAAIGSELVASSPALRPAAPLVRGHHERWDGRGYPDRLSGEDIPLGARIVSVCDAHDAMAHTRHYRRGMDDAKVRAILVENAGAQWDEHLVTALLRRLHRLQRTDEVAGGGEALDATALDAVGRSPGYWPPSVDSGEDEQGTPEMVCADAVPGLGPPT